MARKGTDAIKIVTLARAPGDCLRVLELIPFGRVELGLDVIAFCMGNPGRWSRLASLILGSPLDIRAAAGPTLCGPWTNRGDDMRKLLEILKGKEL